MNFDRVIETYGVAGLLLVLAAFGLYQWAMSRTKVSEIRDLKEAEDNDEYDAIEQETQRIKNRLAIVALDREEQLSRLKTEYSAQSDLLRETMRKLQDCHEVEVTEYRHQVEMLLDEIKARDNTIAARDQTIARQASEIAILEALKIKDEPS